MRCLRRILKIKWCDVLENKITNISIRKSFNNIRTINFQITKRRLTFLGKIIRLPRLKVPSRLISACCSTKRPLGRPNYTIRHTMLNAKMFILSDHWGFYRFPSPSVSESTKEQIKSMIAFNSDSCSI